MCCTHQLHKNVRVRVRVRVRVLGKRALFLWQQEDTSSLRLFNFDSHRQMIRNFSLRERLHFLLELEPLYGECDERMRQEIKYSILLSLRVQICLLSSVEFLCLAWRNHDTVWFLYLVMKSFYGSPIYVSVVLLSLRLTVSWLIIDTLPSRDVEVDIHRLYISPTLRGIVVLVFTKSDG